MRGLLTVLPWAWLSLPTGKVPTRPCLYEICILWVLLSSQITFYSNVDLHILCSYLMILLGSTVNVWVLQVPGNWTPKLVGHQLTIRDSFLQSERLLILTSLCSVIVMDSVAITDLQWVPPPTINPHQFTVAWYGKSCYICVAFSAAPEFKLFNKFWKLLRTTQEGDNRRESQNCKTHHSKNKSLNVILRQIWERQYCTKRLTQKLGWDREYLFTPLPRLNY